MANDILIPQNVEKVVKITVEDTSAPLRRLLTDLVNDVSKLKERVKVLEDANTGP
jgi:hypothetical protein